MKRRTHNPDACPACGHGIARHVDGDRFACKAVGCGHVFARSRAVPRRMRQSRIRPKVTTPEERAEAYVENYGALADVCRTIPCIVRGCERRKVEVCHVKTRRNNGPWIERGGKRYGNLVPMCMEHHREQHTLGIESFERAHNEACSPNAGFVVRVPSAVWSASTLVEAAHWVGVEARLRGVDPHTNRMRR